MATRSRRSVHLRPRRARAQPQKRRCRPAARQPGGRHGPVGLGQVLARVRHDLCRGPAPLRRKPVGLRAPVPGADEQARRRFHRRPVARHFHRAEDDEPQPALDRRHRDGNLRLSAPALCARRRALLARHRPADRKPDRHADGRPHPRDEGRNAALPACPRRARAQGRVPQGTAGTPEEGLPARQGRRQALRDRRGPHARQEAQARHRGRGGPSRREAGSRPAPCGLHRDGAQPRRRPAVRRERRHGRAHRVQLEVRLPRFRLHDLGNRAAAVLVQQPVRRLPRPATGWARNSISTPSWSPPTIACRWKTAPSPRGSTRPRNTTRRRWRALPSTSRSPPRRRSASSRKRCRRRS